MKDCPISLPETAKEYLENVYGKCAVLRVRMKDGRYLKVEYSLQPRYSCGEDAKPISEDATHCPVCGDKI